MSSDTIHILNGDALREQLGPHLIGQIIVLNECLVEGDIRPYDELPELFEQRARLLSSRGWTSIEDYHRKTASELSRIGQIAEGSEVVMWFEEDLFCQVNCWFCCQQLAHGAALGSLSLCMPDQAHRYGFGGMSVDALLSILDNRQPLDDDTLVQLAELWSLYLAKNTVAMRAIGKALEDQCPWLPAAIEADIQRRPDDGSEGRPLARCRQLIDELGADFPAVFRAFCRTEAIYGYGDLQVRHLFDQVIGDSSRS